MMGDDFRLASLIRLQTAFPIGSRVAYRIYNAAKDANISCSDAETLYKNGLITPKQRSAIEAVGADKVSRILNDCKRSQIRPICIDDGDYPECLRNIDVPPLVLYIKGEMPDSEAVPHFCIVGPREVSKFGQRSAYALGKRLAAAGFVIVSGAATGSDTYAHIGAMDAGGKTVAFLGCGINYDYLPQNRNLRERISKNGCLISEHPPYASTTKYSFPVRNRLLAGLSLGVAVVEAKNRSGSLITARYANEQGKDVFVIPGNPTDPNYKGSNALLRDGAIPLIDAGDIFTAYIPLFPDKIDLEKAYAVKEEKRKKEKIGLSKEAEMVYNSLNKQKFTADDLAGTGIDIDVLLPVLTELEMKHLIRTLPGGYYEVCR